MQVNGIKLKRCGIIGYGSGWGIAHVIYGLEIGAWAMGFSFSSGALFGYYYIIILTASITCGAIIRADRI